MYMGNTPTLCACDRVQLPIGLASMAGLDLRPARPRGLCARAACTSACGTYLYINIIVATYHVLITFYITITLYNNIILLYVANYHVLFTFY